jgi:polyribonucleotide nucleotidyltransferase
MFKIEEIIEKFDFNGVECSLATNKIARRSNAAVEGRMGGTVVLATVDVDSGSEGADYFPLNVEYIEKHYAGGVISSSRFIKREGHPSTDATLAARMLDRSIRSRFPSDYRNNVAVVLTVLSYDEDYDPLIIGFSAVSAALMISDVPFEGPISGVRVGYHDKNVTVVNKDLSLEENGEFTDLNFVLGTDGKVITMIDADANILSEDTIAEAMNYGVEQSNVFIDAQKSFVEKYEKKFGDIVKPEYQSYAVPKPLIDEVMKSKKKDVESALQLADMEEKKDELDAIKHSLFEEYEGKYSKSQIAEAVNYVTKKIVRAWILDDNKRTDGRALDEIRPLYMELGYLPKTHGSALFQRGNTQALTVTTLGSSQLAQLSDDMRGEGSKSYMHHYSAPSYTVGEAGRYNYYPKRRELGHGALAEKALIPVIPEEEEFPYTIRVVSEIMAQAGSSSMASVCGSTLSLMDAGVPLKEAVAGIAMGVITKEDMSDYVVLTDIAEWEDFFGDMDFKVAGTKDGITAIQMDNKAKGLPVKVFEDGLKQAKEARLFLLGEMAKIIDKPRESVSENAPKIEVIEIPQSKIGDVIGPGGKIIKAIIEETGAEIDIKDDGRVMISAKDEQKRKLAEEKIKGLTEEPEVGKVYTGKVDKIMDFGAFVNVSPAISGLVHVSEIADEFVKDPHKFVKEGQEVKVKVIGIDEKGRVKMSMKQVK